MAGQTMQSDSLRLLAMGGVGAGLSRESARAGIISLAAVVNQPSRNLVMARLLKSRQAWATC
jgi:hypothetical protein